MANDSGKKGRTEPVRVNEPGGSRRVDPLKVDPAASRRCFCQFLASTAALASAGLVSAPYARAASSPLDLNHHPDRLRALMKMRGNLGPEMVIGWLRAERFAYSQGRVEPLSRFIAATYHKFRQVSDDLFEAAVLEITHYTDFHTGKLLETLVMPFSNREVEVPAYRGGPEIIRFAVNLEEREDYAPSKDTTMGEFAPAGTVLMSKSIDPGYIRGGELFLRHEEYGRVRPKDSELPSLFYKESTIWSAPADEVLDPATTNVNAMVSYSAMTSWRPWQEMGDIPGHTASNGFGRKAASPEDLPEDFLRYTKIRHPDVIEDPEGLLDSVLD
jgi:hypothetical protein